MTSNTSPQSRPSNKRARPKRAELSKPAPQTPKQRPTTLGGRIRRFVPSILWAYVALLVAVTLVVLIATMIIGEGFSHMGAFISQGWLLLHVVPVVTEAATIGVVAILLAFLTIAVVSRQIRSVVKAQVSIVDVAVVAVATLVLPLVLSLIAWAVLYFSDTLVTAPNLLIALGSTLGVHAVALLIGLGPRLLQAIFRKYRIPVVLIDATRTAFSFLATYAGVAAVALIVLLAFSWPRQQEMLAAYPESNAATISGLIGLTVLYLGNVLVALMSVFMGADFQFGSAQVSLFDIHLTPLPPLPMTALIPPTVGQWAPALLLLPAVAAVIVAVRRRPSLSEGVLSGVMAGLLMALIILAGFGGLGIYEYVGPTWWMAGLAAVAWQGLVSSAVAGVVAFRTQPSKV